MPGQGEMSLVATGLLATVARGQHEETVRSAMQSAATQAMEEWARGRAGAVLPLPLRFTAQGMRRLRLTPRSGNYTLAVANSRGGQYVPYRSPARGLNVGELVLAAARAAADPQQIRAMAMTAARMIDRPGKPHMADLLMAPGGTRVRVSGKRKMKVTLTLPAARILNRVPNPQGKIYRDQLIGWDRPEARPGGEWVMRRTMALYQRGLAARVKSVPPTRFAGRRAG